jgi:hypothetical protein
MARCNPDVISMDQSVDIAEGIDRIGTNFAVQVRQGGAQTVMIGPPSHMNFFSSFLIHQAGSDGT